MIADARVEANAFDDLAGIETQSFRIAIQLVKVSDAHCQVSVGKEFNRLCFRRIGKQCGDVLLNRPLLEHPGKTFCAL